MDEQGRLETTEADGIASPKPAPGSLEIVQDFINTQHLVRRTEALSTPAQLKSWLVERGLLAAGTRLTKADLGRALDVRDGFRALLLPTLGRAVAKGAMVQLDTALRGACPQVRFDREGTSRIEPGDFNQALGHLVTLVLVSRAAGLWERFKMCRHCYAAFYDYSKNRGTLWCTRRCGDRVRARRHRRRVKRFRERHSRPRPFRIPACFRHLIEQDESSSE